MAHTPRREARQLKREGIAGFIARGNHLVAQNDEPEYEPIVAAPDLDAYRAALAAHDWYFEYSDDHGVWCAGRASLARITNMQRALDPDLAIWNLYAPHTRALS